MTALGPRRRVWWRRFGYDGYLAYVPAMVIGESDKRVQIRVAKREQYSGKVTTVNRWVTREAIRGRARRDVVDEMLGC